MTRPPDADLLLGVDAGTTLCKAALYAPDGCCLAVGAAKQGIASPTPGWAEQQPADWWRGLRRAVRQALASSGIAGDRIAAIGLSTQGGTLAVFDADGRPRGPALVWSDARQRAIGRDPAAEEEQFSLTGLGHLNMTPAAISWLRGHRPEWFVGQYRIGYVPDYLTFRLTGEWVSDPTNLAISNLYRLTTRDLALPVIARLGLPREVFALIRQAGEVAGHLSPKAASRLGLRPGIPVAVPAHDQYAAALAAGCTDEGQVLLSAGTAWVLVLATREPVTDRRSSFWVGPHVRAGRWGLLGAISSGSSTLDRVLALTRERPNWERINAAAERVPPGSDDLLVIPHLVGRTLPTWDSQARGAILGLSLGHTREHLWRAAMEGVAMETRVACEYLGAVGRGRSPAGLALGALRVPPPAGIRMVGGAARSALWASVVASVIGLPVHTCESEDMAARGAACLAARALGAADLPHLEQWVEHRPIAEWRDRYESAYARYRQAVAALEEP